MKIAPVLVFLVSVCIVSSDEDDNKTIEPLPKTTKAPKPPPGPCQGVRRCLDPNSKNPSGDCVEQGTGDNDFICDCYYGYAHPNDDDQQVCQELNECEGQDIDCGDYSVCVNNEGSFVCVCLSDGYFSPDSTGRNCKDINECEASGTKCSDKFQCVNTDGSYECVCQKGYMRDTEGAMTCVDEDECETGAAKCVNAKCVNLEGSYECDCLDGYQTSIIADPDIDEATAKQNKELCYDIDECDDPEVFGIKCAVGEGDCKNLDGSWSCDCKPGYENPSEPHKDSQTCKKIDKCQIEKPCGDFSNCEDTDDNQGYSCSCYEGYKSATDDGKNCQPQNACAKNPCGPNSICKSTGADTYECKCKDGFNTASGTSEDCHDIDECEIGDPCGDHSVCTNEAGSFHCNCVKGYVDLEGDERNCEDEDECETQDLCPKHSSCRNVPGSFACDCDKGYTHENTDDPSSNCSDIDECVNQQTCDSEIGVCINEDSTYRCKCKEGYDNPKDDDKSCEDVNECAMELDTCDKEKSSCKNLKGDYWCECKPGFDPDVPQDGSSDSNKRCTNINECKEMDICGQDSECHDTEGSYECRCLEGWERKGDVCVDINECREHPRICGPNSLCDNFDGGYTCTCKTKFESQSGDPKSNRDCTGPSICDTVNCGKHSECEAIEYDEVTDKYKDYKCECNYGYESPTNDGQGCAPAKDVKTTPSEDRASLTEQPDIQPDSSDNNGPASCVRDEFECADGSGRLSCEKTCDGANDCDDFSDERGCQVAECTDGSRHPRSRICDANDDCGDGSDEQSHICQQRPPKKCDGSEEVMAAYRWCDGINDCADMSDESSCLPCHNYTKMFWHPDWKCDGIEDCGDMTDETDCKPEASILRRQADQWGKLQAALKEQSQLGEALQLARDTLADMMNKVQKRGGDAAVRILRDSLARNVDHLVSKRDTSQMLQDVQDFAKRLASPN